MKAYKLKINGEIDFIIISPQVLSSLIAQIHNSPEREVAVNIKDISSAISSMQMMSWCSLPKASTARWQTAVSHAVI